jgi:hypothetical protein
MATRTWAPSLLLALATVSSAAAQDTAAAREPRRIATLTVGLGNSMGWFGVQGERYFGPGRLSAFLGAGYTPAVDEGDASGPTFAAGVRGYTRGLKHRGFLELLFCQLAVEKGFGFVANPRRFYGPGVELGYQFASRGGFTALASAGIGWAPGLPEGEKEVGEVLGLGFGYTWRR